MSPAYAADSVPDWLLRLRLVRSHTQAMHLCDMYGNLFRARGSAIGGCRMHPITGSWFGFSTETNIPTGSLNWNQTCLGRIKYRLVHRLATVSHCIE